MAVTVDTQVQHYYDGNDKALPLGIRDYDTSGKAMLVISGVAPTAPVAGSLYYDPATSILYIHNGAVWYHVDLVVV